MRFFLPSTGSSWVEFPRFIGTTRTLSHPAIPLAALRFLRLAIPVVYLVLRSRPALRHLPDGPGVLVRLSPCRDSAGDDRTSHVPEEPSRAFALLSDPGRIDAPWPSRGRRRGPCDFHGKGSGKETFEAQAHGFCTRCLRFAEFVTAPDARLAPAAGSALPDGI